MSQNAYCGLRQNTVHKYYDRMKFEGIEVKLSTFLTLAIYRGAWLASRSGCFTPWKKLSTPIVDVRLERGII
jgi:hypothetical protein